MILFQELGGRARTTSYEQNAESEVVAIMTLALGNRGGAEEIALAALMVERTITIVQ